MKTTHQGDEEELLEAELICPCGGQVRTTNSFNGNGLPSILHALPPCSDFLDKDPLEYVKWITSTLVNSLQ